MCFTLDRFLPRETKNSFDEVDARYSVGVADELGEKILNDKKDLLI